MCLNVYAKIADESLDKNIIKDASTAASRGKETKSSSGK